MSIVKTPGVVGGRARVDGSRIPVWMFVSYFDKDISDADILDWYPTLKQQDIDDAREYIKNNGAEIAQDIEDQNDALDKAFDRLYIGKE